MSRPICVQCGQPYGRRVTETVKLEWKTPAKLETITPNDEESGFSFERYVPTEPPPPYTGNKQIVRRRDPSYDPKTQIATMRCEAWDGESWYVSYEPFCTLRCALRFARKAYRYGCRGKEARA